MGSRRRIICRIRTVDFLRGGRDVLAFDLTAVIEKDVLGVDPGRIEGIILQG